MDVPKTDLKHITLSRSQVEAGDKPLSPELQDLLKHISSAERHAESAYWWFKGIDHKVAEEHNVTGQLANVLSLLAKVDNIAMDIVITIKQHSNDTK